MQGWKGIAWTLALVFATAFVTQLGSQALDIFHTDLATWQAAVNAGIAALIAFAINYLTPQVTRYGIGAK